MKPTLIALLLASFALPATAWFEVDAPKNPDLTKKAEGDGKQDFNTIANRKIQPLVEIGAGVPTPVAGFADRVRLRDGAALLVPDNWEIKSEPSVRLEQEVSWTSGVTWVEALRQIAVANDLVATVDWNRSVISLANAPSRQSIISTSPMSQAKAASAAPQAALVSYELQPVNKTASNSPLAGAVPVPAATPAPGSYATLQDLLNEQVSVDLRSASLIEIFAAIFPYGWEVDLSAIAPSVQSVRGDLTAVEARGAVLAKLSNDLSVAIYPYHQLRKAVIAPRR